MDLGLVLNLDLDLSFRSGSCFFYLVISIFIPSLDLGMDLDPGLSSGLDLDPHLSLDLSFDLGLDLDPSFGLFWD